MANRTSTTVSPWTIGFYSLAGYLMFLGGAFQAIQGLIAIINQNFYVIGTNYIFNFDVATWGWFHLVLGALIAVAGLSVLSGHIWARAIGIVLAILSAVANFFYIPYYPIWSILIIAIDIGIIGALASYDPETMAEV